MAGLGGDGNRGLIASADRGHARVYVLRRINRPNARDMKFDDVVEQAKEATVLVLVF